jgi:hypothetical protein
LSNGKHTLNGALHSVPSAVDPELVVERHGTKLRSVAAKLGTVALKKGAGEFVRTCWEVYGFESSARQNMRDIMRLESSQSLRPPTLILYEPEFFQISTPVN